MIRNQKTRARSRKNWQIKYTDLQQADQRKVEISNNLLKTITGSTWGKDKKTLATTYTKIGRPIAVQIFAPQDSDIDRQGTQSSAALRTINVCYALSRESHLHEETNVLLYEATAVGRINQEDERNRIRKNSQFFPTIFNII